MSSETLKNKMKISGVTRWSANSSAVKIWKFSWKESDALFWATIIEPTFDDMKKQIKAIFAQIGSSDQIRNELWKEQQGILEVASRQERKLPHNQPMGILHSFSIKNIFYDKMDLRLFYFHVTKYSSVNKSRENLFH